MKKRNLIISILSVLFIFFSGCTNNSTHISDTPRKSNDILFVTTNADYYENGVVLDNNNKALFLDFNTLKKTPLCAMPNCTHDKISCLAQNIGATPIFYDDYIYYFNSNYGNVRETSDGSLFFIDSTLMKVSLDSFETEVVCEFHDCAPPQKYGGYVLNGDELFFVGDDQNPKKSTYGGYSWGNTGGNHFICSINLSTGEYTNYGSIYEGDREFESADYSSCANITGIYKNKIYIRYSFCDEMSDLEKIPVEFTHLNFEFDPETKTWAESEMPFSWYMNKDTYTYYDRENEEFNLIYKDKKMILPYKKDVNECYEINGKLFIPDDGVWYDLSDMSQHGMGIYVGYNPVGYYNNSYIFIKDGDAIKLSEEELLAL